MGSPKPQDSGNGNRPQPQGLGGDQGTFWRVEGSLLRLTAIRPVGFFAWNAQSFLERWTRRGGMGVMAAARPALYLTHRVFATRMLHTVLRGVSRDRLDSLGEEYFHYILKPRLKQAGVGKLKEVMASEGPVIVVSQGLDHIMRPLAEHLGVEYLLCNRLEFRDGLATGRLLDPVIRPRGPLARFIGERADGRVPLNRLAGNLGFQKHPEILRAAVFPVRRDPAKFARPVVHFHPRTRVGSLSVRDSLRGKNILLIGGTGFIGKVWLANLLADLPEIGKVFLLIRRSRSTTALERFERIVNESPVFEPLSSRYGDGLPKFLAERIEVIEGDVTRPGLGLHPAIKARLTRTLDLVVNSSGLTDFNPDLRDALASNVDAAVHVVDFLRDCHHAALLHLSTCYVAGARDGRIHERLEPNYTPARMPDFDAEQEWHNLKALALVTESRAESPEIAEELRKQAVEKRTAAKDLHGVALENQIRKNRVRWLRSQLTEAGTRRALDLGWPNTYTFTKSLAESLIQKRGMGLPIAIVRPAIVESSVEKPFRGWNEGINTSASLSYLLGTYFRQLPTNERKCLDVIPVDLVSRGMTLIAAALVERHHEPLYQLATSVTNPCDMRRSIELTSLAHRKHHRAQNGLRHWLRSRFDAIPVSKARYETLSAPAQKAIVQAINRSFSELPFGRPPLARRERELERVIKLIALFEPFILYNDHIFEAENIERLAAALTPEEKQQFGYDPRSIDWWDYWINVHIPALRKWSYPLIEGRPLEQPPRRNLRLMPEPVTTAAAAARTTPASGP
jgi:thioester reductase-like protein/phosphoserine phosphatase